MTGWGKVLECVMVRSSEEAGVVYLDIEPVEKPESVFWVDPTHTAARYEPGDPTPFSGHFPLRPDNGAGC